MQTRRYRWFSVLFAAFMICSLALPSSGNEKESTQEGLAVVNGSVIPKSMLDREIRDIKQRYVAAGKDLSDSKLSEIKKKTIEQLINNALLYQESKKKGIQFDDSKVVAKFELIKGAHATKAEFEKWLTEMNLTEKTLKAQIRRQAAINHLIYETIASKVAVSDKEMKEYYTKHLNYFKQPEQVRVSHILIEVDPQSEDKQKAQAMKTLEKIQSELKEGKDFSALAKKYSQCWTSAKGGDLGYLMPGLMPEPFEKMAFSLKPGKISDIVESKLGYHLIKVTDKKVETITPYEDAKKKAEQYVKYEKTQKKLDEHISQLREKAKIKRFSMESPK